MAGRKPKRRLFDIRTDEVSLVDYPANEEEFLVVKQREGLDMGKKTLGTGANLEGNAPAPDGDLVTGAEDLIKAIGELTAAMTGGAAGDGEEELEKEDGDGTGGLSPKLKAALVTLHRMIAQAIGAGASAGEGGGGEEKKKSSKDNDDSEGDVQKGGKRINATRKGKIVTALKELVSLMEDLDPVALSDMVRKEDDDEDEKKPPKKKDEDEEEDEKKKGGKKGKSKDDEDEEEKGKKTKKGIDGAFELVETLKGLAARMERVETATGVSKVEKAEDGGEQSKGNFWRGVV